MKKIAIMLVGTSLVSMAPVVSAQVAMSPVTPDASQSADAPASSAAPSATATPASVSNGLGDIVVTAQRRSERLRDVPLTISTVSGSQLQKAGINSLRDIQNVVSGFTFSGQGTVAQPAIRGISTSLSAAGSENPNALYVDGIYQATQAVLSESLPDVERIEVLKGPQGTLFGRNATGGAVQLFTRSPSFTSSGDFSLEGGYFTGDGGSHAAAQVDVRGFVTGQVIPDLLAASVSAGYLYTPGYNTNDADGSRTGLIRRTNLRGKFLLTPTDSLKITVTGFRVADNDQGLDSGYAFDGLSAAAQYPGSVVPTKPWHTAYDGGGVSGLGDYNVAKLKQSGASVKAELLLDFGTLTSLTGYDKTSTFNLTSIASAEASFACIANFACIDFDFRTHNREVSQEFNFASRDFGIFSFVTGLYYYNAKGQTFQTVQETLIPGGIDAGQPKFETTSYAAYGEATLKPFEGVSIIGGLRYNHEPHKDSDPGLGIAERDKTFNSVTPRASIRYTVTPAFNVYATYSVGYKSGLTGVTNSAIGFTPVKPEKLNSYEIGAKYGSHDLSVDLSGFYYDYRNKQEQTFTGTSTIIQNTGPIKLYGVDFDSNLHLTSDFSAQLNATWIPVARYRDFPNATGQSTVTIPFVPVTAATPLGCAPGGGCGSFYPGIGNTVGTSFDATGFRLLRTPKISANGTLTYNHKMANGSAIDASTTLSYSSAYNHELTGIIRQGAYATLAAQIGYTFTDTHLRVSIFGRNLTNKAYIAAATVSSAGFVPINAAPRIVGMNLNYSF